MVPLPVTWCGATSWRRRRAVCNKFQDVFLAKFPSFKPSVFLNEIWHYLENDGYQFPTQRRLTSLYLTHNLPENSAPHLVIQVLADFFIVRHQGMQTERFHEVLPFIEYYAPRRFL